MPLHKPQRTTRDPGPPRPSTRKVKESADTWLGFFESAINILVDEDTPQFEYLLKVKQARVLADVALEEYEDRWGGV